MVRPQRRRTLLHPLFLAANAAGVTALFTQTSRRDTRSATLLSNGRGESPYSRKLLLTTEEFNCKAKTPSSDGKGKELSGRMR